MTTLPTHARVGRRRRRHRRRIDRLSPGQARRPRRRAARAGPAHLRHDVARRRTRRPDARDAQRDADEPLRHRALRVARAGDRPRDRLEALRQPERREDEGPAHADEAPDGAREELRRRVRVHHRPRRPAGSRRSCAPTISPAPCGSPATARRIRPTSRSRSHAARACAARRSPKASRSPASTRATAASAACAGRRPSAEGAIACETIVNCGGQWARALGRASGVTVPLYAAEHFYLVTKPIAGVTSDLPVIRDPDGYLYYKEEVGGLVMGGFEPEAKPWNVDPIPDGFEFQLLPEDWDHFEILMRNAIHRTPCLETAEVKLLLNGPESFTLDGNFILGEAPELAGYFVCAGFNSAGHRQRGRRGQARRRVDRRRRGAGRPVGRRHPPLRAVPRESPAPRRPHRRDARPSLRDALAARGARDRAPAAALAALRPARREGRRVRLEDELGARELFPSAGRRAPSVHVRHARLAAARARRAARLPRGCRRRSTRRRSASSCSRVATRSRCCSGCARTRSTCRSGGWSTRRC